MIAEWSALEPKVRADEAREQQVRRLPPMRDRERALWAIVIGLVRGRAPAQIPQWARDIALEVLQSMKDHPVPGEEAE